MVESPKKLVLNLKKQHQILKDDLSDIFNMCGVGVKVDGVKAVEGLAKFKSDLQEHIKLENGVFYPDFLNTESEMGNDTEKTREFIAIMDEIGSKVIVFWKNIQRRMLLRWNT